MSGRKGQITFFVTMGLVIVIAVSLIFYTLNYTNYLDTRGFGVSDEEFMQLCSLRMIDQAVQNLAYNGGYLYDFPNTFDFDNHRFAYHLMDSNITSPTYEFMENEMNRFLQDSIVSCARGHLVNNVKAIIGSNTLTLEFLYDNNTFTIKKASDLRKIISANQDLISRLNRDETVSSGELDSGFNLKVIPLNLQNTLYTLSDGNLVFNSVVQKSGFVNDLPIDLDSYMQINDGVDIDSYYVGYVVENLAINGLLILTLNGGYLLDAPENFVFLGTDKVPYHYYNGNTFYLEKKDFENQLETFLENNLPTMTSINTAFDVRVDIAEEQIIISTSYQNNNIQNIVPIPLGTVLDVRNYVVDRIADNPDAIILSNDNVVEINYLGIDESTSVYSLYAETGIGVPIIYRFAVKT